MELQRAMNLLGINNLKEIIDEKKLKKFYRDAALKHHPDKGGDKMKFQEVQSAFELISTGKAQPKQTSSPKNTTNTAHKNRTRKQRRRRPLDPRDIEIKVVANADELVKGFEYEAHYARRRMCHHCQGHGPCHLCNESRVLIEDVVVKAYVHEDLMNSEDEIIYVGHGDQMHEKGDLIIKVLTTY